MQGASAVWNRLLLMACACLSVCADGDSSSFLSTASAFLEMLLIPREKVADSQNIDFWQFWDFLALAGHHGTAVRGDPPGPMTFQKVKETNWAVVYTCHKQVIDFFPKVDQPRNGHLCRKEYRSGKFC